jgi:hypothetical protein
MNPTTHPTEYIQITVDKNQNPIINNPLYIHKSINTITLEEKVVWQDRGDGRMKSHPIEHKKNEPYRFTYKHDNIPPTTKSKNYPKMLIKDVKAMLSLTTIPTNTTPIIPKSKELPYHTTQCLRFRNDTFTKCPLYRKIREKIARSPDCNGYDYYQELSEDNIKKYIFPNIYNPSPEIFKDYYDMSKIDAPDGPEEFFKSAISSPIPDFSFFDDKHFIDEKQIITPKYSITLITDNGPKSFFVKELDVEYNLIPTLPKSIHLIKAPSVINIPEHRDFSITKFPIFHTLDYKTFFQKHENGYFPTINPNGITMDNDMLACIPIRTDTDEYVYLDIEYLHNQENVKPTIPPNETKTSPIDDPLDFKPETCIFHTHTLPADTYIDIHKYDAHIHEHMLYFRLPDPNNPVGRFINQYKKFNPHYNSYHFKELPIREGKITFFNDYNFNSTLKLDVLNFFQTKFPIIFPDITKKLRELNQYPYASIPKPPRIEITDEEIQREIYLVFIGSHNKLKDTLIYKIRKDIKQDWIENRPEWMEDNDFINRNEVYISEVEREYKKALDNDITVDTYQYHPNYTPGIYEKPTVKVITDEEGNIVSAIPTLFPPLPSISKPPIPPATTKPFILNPSKITVVKYHPPN